jgi:hypothetical protein
MIHAALDASGYISAIPPSPVLVSRLQNWYMWRVWRQLWLMDSDKVNTQMIHGTKRACSIAHNPWNVGCNTNCNLCCILRGSYNMERAKESVVKTVSLQSFYLFEQFATLLARMFGTKIYSSLVSSKADIYYCFLVPYNFMAVQGRLNRVGICCISRDRYRLCMR